MNPPKNANDPISATEREAIERMQQPIDAGAEYRISGRAVIGLYQLIDEIPMKYARQLLPALAGNLERIEG